MARRAGVSLTIEDFDRISREVPVVVNLRPAGEFLMEDFHDAGGVPALLSRLRPYLALDCRTVAGGSLGDAIAGAEVLSEEVIRPLDRPLAHAGGTFVLRGNLAPDGCVIKPTAAEPRLLKHTGPALVFATYGDLKTRIDQEDLDVTADHVIVLQNAGPIGAPGMPEWGMLPIPKKLLRQGIRDMVRISDARMSGTSYGTCVLHVAPEAAIGGPLALVRDGDLIEIDVAARRIHLHVSDEALATRKAAWNAPPRRYERGYSRLFLDHTSQAPDGCDFTFLERGAATPEPDIY
jgi:dihydroxy-acid dehydratase